jgi:hypothetical protein
VKEVALNEWHKTTYAEMWSGCYNAINGNPSAAFIKLTGGKKYGFKIEFGPGGTGRVCLASGIEDVSVVLNEYCPIVIARSPQQMRWNASPRCGMKEVFAETDNRIKTVRYSDGRVIKLKPGQKIDWMD